MRQWVAAFLVVGICVGIGVAFDRAVLLSRKPATLPLTTTACDSRLVAQVVLRNAADFERANQLVAHFDNCKDDGDAQRCSATTASGALVTYRCNVEGCEVLCGGGK